MWLINSQRVSNVSIKPLLRKDASYLKWRRIRQQAEALMVENGLDEIMELHKLRASTSGLLATSYGVATILEASMKDQSYRSRVVTILVRHAKIHSALYSITDGLMNYILVHYGRQIPCTTKTDKVSYTKNLLEPAYTAIQRLKHVMEACDYVLTDIDKCAWAFSTVMKGLEMKTKREHIV